MSDIIFTLAQFIFILWPLFIITALIYSFQGRMRWGAFLQRVFQSLFVTWSFLVIVWLTTLFAPLPTPSLIPEPWNTLIFMFGYGLLLIGELSRLGFLHHRLDARVDMRRMRSLQDLKTMDPYAFENLVVETYRSLGYKADHVGHSGDHGVDIEMLSPKGEYWIVQCKRYQGSVGESVVRDLYGTMNSEKAARAVLVTTASITPPARQWAQGKPIHLLDGQDLLQLIDEAHRRSSGTLIDRLSVWFESLFRPSQPPGLITPPTTSPFAEMTQPVKVGSAPVDSDGSLAPTISLSLNGHAPYCPNCGSRMVLSPPRPSDRPGRVLYRCRNYPACRVVVEKSTGPSH